MDRLKPLNSLSLEGNLLQNWKTWKQNFALFMTATEYNGKSEEVNKFADILHWGKDHGSLQYLCFFHL